MKLMSEIPLMRWWLPVLVFVTILGGGLWLGSRGNTGERPEIFRMGEHAREYRNQALAKQSEESDSEDRDPVDASEASEVLAGVPVGENLIRSPYVSDGPYIDVSGLAEGTVVECPSTGKGLRIPHGVPGL